MARMKRNGRILAINGVLVLVLAAAVYGAYVFLWPSEEGNAAAGTRTVAVTRTSVVEAVSAAGTVQSGYTANADFGASGTVAEINVKLGDVVAAGQQLAKLNDTEARLQVEVAQSNVDVAEEDLANAEDADTEQAAAGAQQPSTTSLQAKVDQAELALEQAEQALATTVLTAPGAGTVTAINGAVGQRVGGSTGTSGGTEGTGTSTGTTATTTTGFIVLTDLANLAVEANVAEIDVSKIKAGQDATVTVNALPDAPVQAKVTQIDLTPTTTNNVVQFGVTLGLTQPPAGLRPGQSTSVAITVAKADDALAVPSAAVQTAGGQNTVSVLENGTQSTRPVQVGVRSESLVQVTSGLAEGDQVVLTLPSGAGSSGGGERMGGQLPGGGQVPGAQLPGAGGGAGR